MEGISLPLDVAQLFMILIYIISLFVAHCALELRFIDSSAVFHESFESLIHRSRVVYLIVGGRFDHRSTSRRCIYQRKHIDYFSLFPYTRYKYKRSELNQFLRNFFAWMYNLYSRMRELYNIEEGKITFQFKIFVVSLIFIVPFASRWSKWKYLWGTW